MASITGTDLKASLRPKSASPNPGKGGFLPWLEIKLLALLPAISFAFMIYSSITAIYQSNGDPATIAFVVGALSILGGLYWCMHEFERAVAQKATAKKERLKMAIWLLAMALNTLFSYRVTSVMDSTTMSIIVWGIAAVTTLIGCYLMFFTPQTSDDAGSAPITAQTEKTATLSEVKLAA